MSVVAKLVQQIAEAHRNSHQSSHQTVVLELAVMAACLHDLVRLPEQWPYLPADIKTPLSHAEVNYLLLRDRWPELAAVIREHSLMQILRPQAFSSFEAKLVYYADKRVNHDQLVSVSQRLQLGQERWTVAPDQDRSTDLLNQLTALEQELFSGVTLTPTDLYA